ncbi:MAG: 4-alpha-glucanotransferase [Fusobacteriota bacterium]
MNFERSSGILLHPTSLPGDFGIGTLGKEAYDFVDFLIESGQSLWQTYPLGPTGYGDSPYQCFSAFAGNPLLIDLKKLVEDSLLKEKDLETDMNFSDDKVEYGDIINFKYPLLKKSFNNFQNHESDLEIAKFERFCEKNSTWLVDYSLFMALKDHFNGKPWNNWEEDIKLRKPKAMKKYHEKLHVDIKFHKFIQYLFFKQWEELKNYANQNYIKIIGDIPIFVAFDSADAWSNPELFLFDKDRNPTGVAGVPPDYFSETGQLWGNPLYDWDKLKENNYSWWVDRIKANLEISDIIRIDHFRGFEAYWKVPADEDTAINGEWVKGPDKDLFDAIENELGELPIIAEDLGLITPEVEELRDYCGFPGMKILQFAFDSGEENDYLPHNYVKNCVVYTGTHDNDTIKGWYDKAKSEDKEYVDNYFYYKGEDVCWNFIRAAWASTAVMALAPLQDLLRLGSEARINTPGKASGNWQWRFKKGDITEQMKKDLKNLNELYSR